MKTMLHMTVELDGDKNGVTLRVQALDSVTIVADDLEEFFTLFERYARGQVARVRKSESIMAVAVAPEWAYNPDRDEVKHVSASRNG